MSTHVTDAEMALHARDFTRDYQRAEGLRQQLAMQPDSRRIEDALKKDLETAEHHFNTVVKPNFLDVCRQYLGQHE
jgi:hypothetical protein